MQKRENKQDLNNPQSRHRFHSVPPADDVVDGELKENESPQKVFLNRDEEPFLVFGERKGQIRN